VVRHRAAHWQSRRLLAYRPTSRVQPARQPARACRLRGAPPKPRPGTPRPPPSARARSEHRWAATPARLQRPARPLPEGESRPASMEGERAGRRIPARRSSCARRSRRRALAGPRRRSAPRCPRPSPRRPGHPASRRSNRDEQASPCSRTASRSRRSCLRSGPCRRMRRRLRPAREQECLWRRRGRHRGAAPRHTGGLGRRRTVSTPDLQRARSTHAPPIRAAQVRTRSRQRFAARMSPLLSDLRTRRP
jgi:hypothetical protein